MTSMTESRHVDLQHAEAAEKLRQEKLRIAREEYERRQHERMRKLQESEKHAQEVREMAKTYKRDEMMERHRLNEERRIKAEERRKMHEKAAQVWRESVLEKILSPKQRSTSVTNRARSAHATVGERVRSKSEHPRGYAFGSSTPRVVCWGVPNSIPPTKPAPYFPGKPGMTESTTGYVKKDNSRMFQSLHADFATRTVNKLTKDATNSSNTADSFNKKSLVPKPTVRNDAFRKNSLDSATPMSRSTMVPVSHSRNIQDRQQPRKDTNPNVPVSKRNGVPSDGAGTTKPRAPLTKSVSSAKSSSRPSTQQREEIQPDLVMSVSSKNARLKDPSHQKPPTGKNLKKDWAMKRATSLGNKEDIAKRLQEENDQREREIAAYKVKMAEQRNLARDLTKQDGSSNPLQSTIENLEAETPEDIFYKETPSEFDQSTSIEPQSTSDEEGFNSQHLIGQTPNSENESPKSVEDREREERRRRVEDIMSRINRQSRPSTTSDTYNTSFVPPLTPCDDFTCDDTPMTNANMDDLHRRGSSPTDDELTSMKSAPQLRDDSPTENEKHLITDEPDLSDGEMASGAEEESPEATESPQPASEEAKGSEDQCSIELVYGSYSSEDETTPEEQELADEERHTEEPKKPLSPLETIQVEEPSPRKLHSECDEDTFTAEDNLNKSLHSIADGDEVYDNFKVPSDTEGVEDDLKLQCAQIEYDALETVVENEAHKEHSDPPPQPMDTQDDCSKEAPSPTNIYEDDEHSEEELMSINMRPDWNNKEEPHLRFQSDPVPEEENENAPCEVGPREEGCVPRLSKSSEKDYHLGSFHSGDYEQQEEPECDESLGEVGKSMEIGDDVEDSNPKKSPRADTFGRGNEDEALNFQRDVFRDSDEQELNLAAVEIKIDGIEEEGQEDTTAPESEETESPRACDSVPSPRTDESKSHAEEEDLSREQDHVRGDYDHETDEDMDELNASHNPSLNLNDDDVIPTSKTEPIHHDATEDAQTFPLTKVDLFTESSIKQDNESDDDDDDDEEEVSSSSVKVHQLADDSYAGPFMTAAGPYLTEGIVLGKPSIQKISENSDEDKGDESELYGVDEEDVSDVVLPSSEANDLSAIKEVEETSEHQPDDRMNDEKSGTDSDLDDFDRQNLEMPEEDEPKNQKVTEDVGDDECHDSRENEPLNAIAEENATQSEEEEEDF